MHLQIIASRRVVEAFIALICLRDMNELPLYKPFLHYRALPRALYRMRLSLYHMKQFYCQDAEKYSHHRIRLTSFAKHSKVEGCRILKNFITNPKVNFSSAISFVPALCAAYSHLFSHKFSTAVWWDQILPISLWNNERLLQNCSSCSRQVLYCILNLYSKETEEERTHRINGTHPFQIYSTNPFFPIAFISSNLRALFERLITKHNVTKREVLPHIILLAEVLLFIEKNLVRTYREGPLRILLLLRVLDKDIDQCQLQSWSQTIIHRLQTVENCNDWHFSDDHKSITLSEREKPLELIVNRERLRTHSESDIQLFAAAIGLTRALILMRNESDGLLEEAETAALNIQDPVLKIVCLRHLRETICSCINTKYYWSIQEKIDLALKNLIVEDMSLLTLTLVLGTCTEEQLYPSTKHLLDYIWNRLQCLPSSDEEQLDQKAVFQTIRNIFGCCQIPVSDSVLTRSRLFHFNSSIFHTVFQTVTLDSTETILLAQLYLAQVTVDAQILTQFTEKTVSIPINLVSSCARNILKHSWKSHYGKFPHRQVLLLNTLILSPTVEFDDIPFETLGACTGFEQATDRPIVESWLKYYDNTRCVQIAVLAAFLLARTEEDMLPSIRSLVEMIFINGFFSKVDWFRQGTRACFTSPNGITWSLHYYGWSVAMWRQLRTLMIGSLSKRFAFHYVTTVEQMKSVLDAERQRLSVYCQNDLYQHFSLLTLLDKTWDNDGSDIYTHF